MYARASSMSADPGKIDEAARMLSRTCMVSWNRWMKFRGVAALAQRDSGKSLVVTFWDSEDALTASEERASQMRSKAADETGATSTPQVDRYEVIFYRSREK